MDHDGSELRDILRRRREILEEGTSDTGALLTQSKNEEETFVFKDPASPRFLHDGLAVGVEFVDQTQSASVSASELGAEGPRRRLSRGARVNGRSHYPLRPCVEAVNSRLQLSRSKQFAAAAAELLHSEEEYCGRLRRLMSYSPERAPPALEALRPLLLLAARLLWLHRALLAALHAADGRPRRLAAVFEEREKDFDVYIDYSKQHKKANDLAYEYRDFFKIKQTEMNETMDICSYLLEPVQRMPRYLLLLRKLAECAEAGVESGDEGGSRSLVSAVAVTQRVLKKINDGVALDCIRDCPVNLQEQGDLLRQHEFLVTTPRRKRLMVCFLFEKLLLFTARKRIKHEEVLRYKEALRVQALAAQPGRLTLWARGGRARLLQGEPRACAQWAATVAALLQPPAP